MQILFFNYRFDISKKCFFLQYIWQKNTFMLFPVQLPNQLRFGLHDYYNIKHFGDTICIHVKLKLFQQFNKMGEF